MHRFMLTAVLVASAALYVTGHQDILLDEFGNEKPVSSDALTSSHQQIKQVKISAPGHEEIKASPSGHFIAHFRVNGRDVEGLVDTGATFVALNETTARRLGISRSDLDFRYAVTTANGTTEAAHVNLDRVEFGSIRVHDVEAFVLKDQSLSGMLVGMSFLKKLKSYKVENGILYLKN